MKIPRKALLMNYTNWYDFNFRFDFGSNNCDCQLLNDNFNVENKRKSLNKNPNNSFCRVPYRRIKNNFELYLIVIIFIYLTFKIKPWKSNCLGRWNFVN